MKGNATATINWEGHEVYFTVIVYGKSWYIPEKRVDGNPTMIESFAESGIKIKDWDYDELIIDGEPKDGNSLGNKLLDDEILGWLEENEDKIEWEFDD